MSTDKSVRIRTHWSDEDQAFVATSPEYPSLSYMHPDDYEEAIQGLYNLIQEIRNEDD